MLLKSKNTFLAPTYVDNLLSSTINKIHDDFEILIDTVLLKLKDKHTIIKQLIELGKPTKWFAIKLIK